MEENSNTAFYKPLQISGNIRLLHIEPDHEDEDVILCTISEVSLASKPRFEALSYTWGDGIKSENIHCHGSLIPVTANLYSALHHFRSSTRRRTLWVDAICINQADVSERNDQVQRMGVIYSQAEQVLVWLGEETYSDAEAFSMIERFEGASSIFQQWFSPELALGTILPENDSPEWPALAELLQRPWFRRVWVIQEVAAATNVLVFCGTQKTSWQTLLDICSYIRYNGLSLYLGPAAHSSRGLASVSIMALFRSMVRSNGANPPLIKFLVSSTRSFSATDPRDNIFGLLGIASDAKVCGVSVDYNMTCEELFTSLVVGSYLAEKNLLFLSYAGYHSQRSLLTLPTWVPDWSLRKELFPGCLGDANFNAATTTTVQASPANNHTLLRVRGLKFDTLKSVGKLEKLTELAALPSLGTRLDRSRVEARLFAEWEEIASVAQKYPTGEDISAIYWRILVCDRDITSMSSPFPDYYHGYLLLRHMFGNLDSIAENGEELLDPSLEGYKTLGLQYSNSLGTWSSGRVFCATQQRYLGWVPYGSLEGDVVCVLLGASVPYVLRPCDDGAYKLVGECYIHGIMNGELVGETGLIEETFTII